MIDHRWPIDVAVTTQEQIQNRTRYTYCAHCSQTDLGQTINISAAALLLRARACAGMQLQPRALSWYCAAVVADPYCYEALSAVLKSHSLNNAVGENLVQELRMLRCLGYHVGVVALREYHAVWTCVITMQDLHCSVAYITADSFNESVCIFWW